MIMNDTPVATITQRADVCRIVHVNRAAAHLRLRAGQTLADAKAITPELELFPDDPAADRRALESLALWAGFLSPMVHLEGEDTLLLDITGCAHLFDGEENLLRQATDGLTTEGYTVRAAVADTAGAAWAMAHAGDEPAMISPPGQVAADLAPLPVWSLRIDAKTASTLTSIGVDSVASLFHLPRSSLAARFSGSLLDRIDQALGDALEILTPYRPEPALTCRLDFGTATTRLEIFREGIKRALVRFCDRLAHRVGGVRRMYVTFYCPDVETEEGTKTRTVTLPVDLSQPTRSPDHLHALLTVLLDRLHLPAPAAALMIWTREVERLDGFQVELFNTGSHDTRALADLVDRLSVRLGAQCVVRVEPMSDHQPERAFRYVPLVDSSPSPQDRPCSSGHDMTNDASYMALCGRRPLRLSHRPIDIAATSIAPSGPPITFRLSGVRYTVTDSVGPERIETGWWRGPHLKRDYYRVTTNGGRRFWIFRDRDTGRWLLHGWFD